MTLAARFSRLLPASMAPSRPAVVLLAAAGLGFFAWGAYIPAKAWAAQVLLDRAWDQARANKAPSGVLARPWAWADMTPVARLGIDRLGGSNIGYRIVERRVIDTRSEQVMLHPEANLLTLITCYPFEDWTPGGPLRLIVTAEKRF